MKTLDYVDPCLKEKIERKQKERQEQFNKLKKEHVLDEKAKAIVELPFPELRSKLRSRELSARDVLSAFIAKALEVNEEINCVTEFVPQAVKWATNLDSLPSGSSSSFGPLHGLPVAVKEDFDIEGMDSTLGFAKKLYHPLREHAVIIKALLQLGAVPFCKTNVPQSLFSTGSDNPIFGITANALNKNLAPGGSSSGSGCIVAAGGAPFATGSDIGGSLRIPAHMNGVSSLRPTIKRLSDKGQVQCLPELLIVPGVPGIIAPDVATLSVVWRALTSDNLQNKLDPVAVPIPWNETLFTSTDKLRIGYFTSLDVFPAFEDTQKAVLAAKDALKRKGHKVVEFEVPNSYHFVKTVCDLYLSDHGRSLEKVFRGEPLATCVSDFIKSIRARLSGNRATMENFENSGGSKIEKLFMVEWAADIKTSQDLWDLINQKRDITKDILERMEESGVDLLLSPSYPYPAVELNFGHETLPGIAYTAIWNFVDFPAGVVKFGTETGERVESYDDQHDPILKATKEALSGSAGMPIGVQVIGAPFKEEIVLRAMLELENEWKANNN